MRTKFRPDPAGPPWAKDALYRYVAFLEKLIKDLLTSSEVQLTAGEKENLEDAVRAFRPAVNLLAERYFEPMRASQSWACDAGYMTLLEVLQATNFASSHGIVRDSIKNYLTPMISREVAAQWQRERMAPAIKARKAERIQEIIDAAARRYWKGNPHKTGKPSDTVRAILPQVKTDVSKLREIPHRWRDVILKDGPCCITRELDGGQQLDLSPVTLNLINPHVGDAGLPESERYGGLRRNVNRSATDERPPANDRDDHAAAVIEVDDADLRPHRQAAMRRNQSSETRILKI